MEILGLTLGLCLIVVIIWIAIMILAFFLKVAIDFLPATVLAIVVFWWTRDWILALLTFGVLAMIMVVARGARRRRNY